MLFLMVAMGGLLTLSLSGSDQDVTDEESDDEDQYQDDLGLSDNSVSLIGTNNGDVIYGSEENENIKSFGGDDYIISGPKLGSDQDTIFGGDGNDTIRTSGSDTIWGGGGSDTFIAEVDNNSESKIFDFESQEDTISLMISNSQNLYWELPNVVVDRIDGGGTSVAVDGEIVFQTAGDSDEILLEDVHLRTIAEHILGTNNDDVLLGSDDDDIISGYSGNDTLFGGGGDDRLFAGLIGENEVIGGEGNDSIFGGKQSDKLIGSDGDDYIYGGGGDDTVLGGGGDDEIFVTSSDLISGGSGHDVFTIGEVLYHESYAESLATISDFNSSEDKILIEVEVDQEIPIVEVQASGADSILYINGLEICRVVGAAKVLDQSDIMIRPLPR